MDRQIQNHIRGNLTSIRSWLAEFERRDEGQLSVFTVVAVMLCSLLIVLLLNVGHITHQKVELQNTADSVAYSASLWQARAMNEITATNHIIGELNSLVVVHHALGGEKLDSDEVNQATVPVDTKLDIAYGFYQSVTDDSVPDNNPTNLRSQDTAYEVVREENSVSAPSKSGVTAELTLWEAKVELKKLLTRTYYVEGAAELMQRSRFAPVVAAGIAMELGANLLKAKIQQEYEVLNAVQIAARALTDLKRAMRDRVLPTAKQHTTEVRDETPRLCLATAEAVAEQNEAQGTISPRLPELPIGVDPFARAYAVTTPLADYAKSSLPLADCDCPINKPVTDLRRQIVKVTQLARSTFPWVNYHREPILRIFRLLTPLSDAAHFFFDHSNDQAIKVSDFLQTSSRHDMGLYVMQRYPAPDKGHAVWTEDPELADDMFCVTGLAYREPPQVVGMPAVFQQAHKNGHIAYAQAMLYNANPQQRYDCHLDLDGCKRIVPSVQANIGWDTLNWDTRNPRNRPSELVGIGVPHLFPRIRVNWQAKLVPVSRRKLHATHLDSLLGEPFRTVLGQTRASDLPIILKTH